MNCLSFCFIIVLIIFQHNFSHAQVTTIDWKTNTLQFVCPGGYARVKQLSNGEIALVYSVGADIWMRKSKDHGNSWEEALNVAHTEGYNNTNAELAQLSNGWLIYGWNGRPKEQGKTDHFTICTKLSKDFGKTWGETQVNYIGDVNFENGVWEPYILELPSGELQLYFANEALYTENNDQEITLIRSFDHGLTWSKPIAVSYRAGSRDGMPVAIILKNHKGIAMAIEDPGFNGTFKPVIVWTSEKDNWNQPFENGSTKRRWPVLNLAPEIYAGAPYLVQLPTGETILSIQSTEGRENNRDRVSIMQVYVGDDQARNFGPKSTPFPNVPSNGNAMWNSLFVVDAQTVMAISSINMAGTDKNGIWTILGNVIKK